MITVFTVNGYADYDIPVIIGIFSSHDKANKAIKAWNRDNTSVNIKEISYGEYKDIISPSSEEYDYWIEEVKLDEKL